MAVEENDELNHFFLRLVEIVEKDVVDSRLNGDLLNLVVEGLSAFEASEARDSILGRVSKCEGGQQVIHRHIVQGDQNHVPPPLLAS